MTKKIVNVIGLAGKYSLPKMKTGKQTAVTAANPYGFPTPFPVDICLPVGLA